jgi:hypothetical protein
MNVRRQRQEIIAKLTAGAEIEDGIAYAELVTVKRSSKPTRRLVVR